MKHGLIDKDLFDVILKKATTKSKEHPFTFFQKRVTQYWNFRIDCIRSLSARQWIEIANQNFVINIVSALEHYFKQTIIFNAGKWRQSGVAELLQEKITLGEAFSLVKRTRLKPEYLIAHSHSFQSIQSINKVFTSLIGRDFIKSIQDTTHDFGTDKPATIVSKSFDWKARLMAMYRVRNEIIHEGKTEKLNGKKVEQFFSTAITLAFFVNILFQDVLEGARR